MRRFIIPAALLTSGLAIAALLAFGLSGHGGFVGGHGGPPPRQPDPAIARRIETTVTTMPGVRRSHVTLQIDCIDQCEGQRYEFAVDVDLADDVTARQILDVNRAINDLYPGKLPGPWQEIPGRIRYSLHSPSDGGLQMSTTNAERSGVPGRRGTQHLSATQADAFLTAARANPATTASWRSPSPSYAPSASSSVATDDEPTFLVESSVEATNCSSLEDDARASITALAAIRRKGTLGALRFRCESARASVPIGETTSVTGWSSLASTLSRMMTTWNPTTQPGADVSLEWVDDSGVLRVAKGGAGEVPDDVRADANSVLAQLRALHVPDPHLGTS